jgi:hypothetical protein
MPVFTSLFLFQAALELSTIRYCFDVEGIQEAGMEPLSVSIKIIENPIP